MFAPIGQRVAGLLRIFGGLLNFRFKFELLCVVMGRVAPGETSLLETLSSELPLRRPARLKSREDIRMRLS